MSETSKGYKKPKKTGNKRMEIERRYSNEYGRLRRLTSKIDGQIRRISVSLNCVTIFSILRSKIEIESKQGK